MQHYRWYLTTAGKSGRTPSLDLLVTSPFMQPMFSYNLLGLMCYVQGWLLKHSCRLSSLGRRARVPHKGRVKFKCFHTREKVSEKMRHN